jgi:HSP20 family molecular chaperone IbpA
MSEIEQQLRDEIDHALRIAAEPQPVPVNLYPAEEALVLVAPLPGVMADDVEVVIEPGLLTVSAAMRTAAPKDYLLHEWHYGPYRRSIELPWGFGATATASFGNGQLAVHIGRGDATERFVVRPRNGGRS